MSPQDLRKLAGADLLVINGLLLEDWLPKALASLEKRRRPAVVELAAGLPATALIRPRRPGDNSRGAPWLTGNPDERDEQVNPHIWLDPALVAHGTSNVLAALRSISPGESDAYVRNARAFEERLRRLDDTMREGLVDARKTAFVTHHDAFAYLAQRYELRLVGVIEVAPNVEPSPRRLAWLLETIRRENVRVLFTEPRVGSRLPRELAKDTSIRLATLDTLETGELSPTAYEEGMMRNLRVLRENLR